MSAGDPLDPILERAPTAPGGRPPWATIRSALAEAGFRPTKKLGQNFLLDENLVRAIVRDAGVGPGDRVLEVGVGCGFLTLHLLRAGADLLAVEIDARLAQVAARCLEGERPHRLICADVLAGKHALAPQVQAALPEQADWHLVSNLPYSIAGPLLCVLSDLANPPRTMTVLVQLEVARRIAARPGTKAWGPLSLHLQLDYEPRLVRTVSPNLFWPRPAVESALVRLERRPDRGGPGRSEGERRSALIGLAQALFQHRRQGLVRALGDHLDDRGLAERVLLAARIDPGKRAEELDLEAWRALSLAVLAARGEGPERV